MSFECFLPVRVIFGNGKIKELPGYAEKIGKKALVVTSLKKIKVLDNIVKMLDESDIKYTLFEDVKANPTSTLIDKVSEIFKKEKCDYVIGIGGGSSMDFAKAVAIGASHTKDIWNYVYVPYRDALKITEKTYPVIAVTTTSGTGNLEVTKWAVVRSPPLMRNLFLKVNT